MMVMATSVVFVFVIFDYTVDSQIHTQHQEQHGANMPEPFFERTHTACQFGDANRAVTY